MKFAKPLLALALVSSLSVVNAHAIGEREKGALIGAGALLLLPSMVHNMGVLFGGGQAVHQQPVRYHNKPVVVERERVIIIEESHYDRRRHDRCNRKKGDRKDRYDLGQQVIIIQK